jgi:hypothetical protein
MILRHPVLCVALLLGALTPSFAAGEPAVERSRRITLNSVAIDTAAPAAVPEELSVRPRVGDGSEVALVKFPGPVTAAQLRALEAAALRVFTYLPDDTFLVRLPAGRAAEASFRAAVGASWTGPWHPLYKISRWVAAVTPMATTKARRSLMVQVYPDADVEKVVREIRGLGITGVAGQGENPFFSRIRLLLTEEEIARFRDDLARLPDVFWIDFEPRRALLNDTTVWVGQSGLAAGSTTPVFSHGIFGEGQTVAILDTGIDADMCWFRDTSLGLPPTNNCDGGTVINSSQRKVIAADFLWTSECSGGISSTEWDTQDHGSHVAGTVAGDNFTNLLLHDTADGMAPGAKLVIQDGGYQVDSCGDLPGIGCPVVDLNQFFEQAYTQGARIHTNSWGDNEDGAVQNNYTAGSQDVDEFMWNHKDFLIFFAAGNSGPGTATVSSPSTAKSGVSVGATLRGASANGMASFSSCGPTDDLRIKPEVTVPGSSIISANADNNVTSNNCNTKSLSGTSMATPGAAGLTALIRQYYMDGWYPSGAENAIDGFTPSAALLRATLVNSAQVMTGSGTTPIPSNCQGWGRVLLENALSFAPEARKLLAEDDAGFATGSTNESRTSSFTVTSSAEPLKVTLAWTDFPSTPAANPHLNNDLDLTVVGPGGTFLGNVFSAGVSTTGGAADRRNTLEQVILAAPALGAYTVTVRSFNVPNGTQPFALVATGAITINQQPLANAGPDQNVAAKALVTLNGGASSDPDAGPSPLTYLWTQIDGPSAVKISNDNQATATFRVDLPGTYVFQLQVSDGAATATDQISVLAPRSTPR